MFLSFSGLRTQFLAIEIARNREGYNDDLRKTHGKDSSFAGSAIKR
jgi:hypothetical protein